MSQNISDCRARQINQAGLWTELLMRFEFAHPMQTWEWGEARSHTGDRVQRWAVEANGAPVLLAQCFEREWRGFPLRVAWVPRGPVFRNPKSTAEAIQSLRLQLRARGFRLVAVQPYFPQSSPILLRKVPFRQREYTFVVDLHGEMKETERLLRIKGINRFVREGGVVSEYREDDAIQPLVEEYARLVERKGFRAYGGAELIKCVWDSFRESTHTAIGAHVFRAVVHGKTANSCIVLRVGKAAHFMWAAADYELRNLGSGEAMQWHIMNRLRELGLRFYDLEGADEKRNPGVFKFKQKLGGILIQRSPVGFMVL